MPVKDLTNNTYGRLSVISRGENDKKNNARWLCECICGNKKTINSYSLVSGHTKSCGCLANEMSKTQKYAYIHGHCSDEKLTKIYRAWTGMKYRCYNKKSKEYYRYGGRGITVSDRWIDSFEAFLNDVGKDYHDKLCLDRIDNNGNYELGNVRWATYKVNNNNRNNTLKKRLQKECSHMHQDGFLFCPLCGVDFSNNILERKFLQNPDGSEAGVAYG